MKEGKGKHPLSRNTKDEPQPQKLHHKSENALDLPPKNIEVNR